MALKVTFPELLPPPSTDLIKPLLTATPTPIPLPRDDKPHDDKPLLGRVSPASADGEIELRDFVVPATAVVKAESAAIERARTSSRAQTTAFILGDLFTAAYLLFQAIKPHIGALATGNGAIGAAYTSTVCGVIGGGLTTFVGACDIVEGYKTLQKCRQIHQETKLWDKEQLVLGTRLIICGIAEILCGLLLMAAPLIAQFAAHSAIGVILATNPWILPLLFAIPTFVFFVELGPKIYNLCTKNTLAQRLSVKDLLTADPAKAFLTWKETFKREVIGKQKEAARNEARKQAEKIQAESQRILNLSDDQLDQELKPRQRQEEIAKLEEKQSSTRLSQFDREAAQKKQKEAARNEAREQAGKNIAESQRILKLSDDQLDQELMQRQHTEEIARVNKEIAKLEEKQSSSTGLSQEEIVQLTVYRKILEAEETAKDKARLDLFIEEKNIKAALEALGPEAALAVYDLYTSSICDEAKMKAADTKINEWVKIQWIKIAIQLIYLASFIISMSTIKVDAASFAGIMCSSVTNAGLAAANGLPLYLDAFKPFLRNTPVTVDQLKLVDIVQQYYLKTDSKKRENSSPVSETEATVMVPDTGAASAKPAKQSVLAAQPRSLL